MPGIDYELLEEEYDEDFRPPPGQKLSTQAQDRIDEDATARVIAVDRGRVTVLLDGEEVDATFAGSMRGEKVVVGDRVRVRPPERRSDVARITERLPRETFLLRTSDDTRDDPRVVVANADQVVVIIGADYLEGGVRFLDRVLVAAAAGGLDAEIVVNKIDLVADEADVDRDDDRDRDLRDGDPGPEDSREDEDPEDGGVVVARWSDLEAVAERYEQLGSEVLFVSAKTGHNVEQLNWRLEGCWTVMTGHSGVGKSRLFNRLVPDAQQEIGEVGRRGGRHTTVAAKAMRVPGHEDAWLVDTPGVRSFGIGMVDPVDLPRLFPELAKLRCDIPDCVHDGEPGCAIDEADIHPARWESYQRLLSSLRGDDRWEPDEWAVGPGG
ncbi:MAG: ribosome small subunit-dependent GTPase A [Nitriliruptorales bacterium]|nr:ribosome small subunit-dependent GTPase A [Nitriliruptorales bacterium]